MSHLRYPLVALCAIALANACIESCGPVAAVSRAVDIHALELACVETSATLDLSHTCRDAVRQAWAKANGVPVTDLPDGGSHD